MLNTYCVLGTMFVPETTKMNKTKLSVLVGEKDNCNMKMHEQKYV